MGRGVERLAKYYKGIGVKNVSVHLIEGSRHEFLCGRGAPRGRACGDRGVYKADLRAEKMSLAGGCAGLRHGTCAAALFCITKTPR